MSSYGFQDTVTVLETLQEKLEAMQYDGGPLFKKVAIFDMSNLAVALLEIMNFGNRVCIIVHDLENFENKRVGNELHSKQTREVTLMIADKHFANRQIALIGDGDKTPGALKIKDMVLTNQQIVGPIIPGAMYCEPVHGEQLVLEKKVRDELQGRVAFTLGLRLVGGNVIIPLGRQPIV